MPTERNFTATGVDGCKGGWFYVQISPKGQFGGGVVGDLARLMESDEAQRVLIDIPIGLPTKPGGRRCDREARALLGVLKSSVFPAPARAVLDAKSYHEAKLLSKEQTGKSIPVQAWSIVPKVRDVDRLLRSGGHSNLLEVHPEVCFWALNGEKPLSFSKKTHNGFWERLAILERAWPGVGGELKAMDARVGLDDVLDAAVAALTATADDEALSALPRVRQGDSGVPMQMHYTTRQHLRVR